MLERSWLFFFFSSRRRHTRLQGDGVQTCALPIYPRFVVTNLVQTPEHVYQIYRERGDVENRIKELKDGLALDRLSCSRFLGNQFRLLLTAAAYILVQALRWHATGTAWATAQAITLRERVLKVAVWVERSVRRIVLHLPAAFPWRLSWHQLACAVG